MAKLSKVDAAKAAGVSRQTLYTYLKDGRLSADADGLIDTAELLRAGFTLHTGHEIGRQDVDTAGHDLTSTVDTLDVYLDMITLLKQQLTDAQAREQAAFERERTARDREALVLQMLQDMQQRYDRLLDLPRSAPIPHTRPQDAPGATQAPRHAQRDQTHRASRQPTPVAPCAGASWPCSRTIRRASRRPRYGIC